MELAPSWMRGLTPLGAKRAKEELGETAEHKQHCLEQLRRMIEDEEGFEPPTYDAFLLRFLRCKKYDVGRAFKTLKNYFAFKMRYSGVVTDMTPRDVEHIYDTHCMMASPIRALDGSGVFISFTGAFDVDTFTPDDLMASAMAAIDACMDCEMAQVCGNHLVIDLQGMTFYKMRHYSSITFLSKFIRGLQDCWPYRVRFIHITHEPAYWGALYTLAKTMMTKKLKDRVHFHGSDMESLHKFLPAEILPKQLGGTLSEKEFDKWKSVVLANQYTVERLNKYVFQGVKSPRYYDPCVSEGDPVFVIPEF